MPEEAARDVTVYRTFSAPAERLFEAFVDPDVSAWWGPHGFSTTTHAKEVRVGGEWRFTMHGPDGTDYAGNRIVYTQVERPTLLSYDHWIPTDVETPHFSATVTFDATKEGATLVTLRMEFPTSGARDAAVGWGVRIGGEQTLARLAARLAQ
jgi:uncharacterized protein YndB with AHSA1/START domain